MNASNTTPTVAAQQAANLKSNNKCSACENGARIFDSPEFECYDHRTKELTDAEIHRYRMREQARLRKLPTCPRCCFFAKDVGDTNCSVCGFHFGDPITSEEIARKRANLNSNELTAEEQLVQESSEDEMREAALRDEAEHWIDAVYVTVDLDDGQSVHVPTTWFDPSKEGYEPSGCNDFPVYNLKVAFLGHHFLVRRTDVIDGSENRERFSVSECYELTVVPLTPQTQENPNWKRLVEDAYGSLVPQKTS